MVATSPNPLSEKGRLFRFQPFVYPGNLFELLRYTVLTHKHEVHTHIYIHIPNQTWSWRLRILGIHICFFVIPSCMCLLEEPRAFGSFPFSGDFFVVTQTMSLIFQEVAFAQGLYFEIPDSHSGVCALGGQGLCSSEDRMKDKQKRAQYQIGTFLHSELLNSTTAGGSCYEGKS